MQIYKYVALTIAFSTFQSTSVFTQNLEKDSLELIIEKMAKNNIYEVTYSIGYFGSLSVQYQLFEKLLFWATSKELIYYATNNKNGVVRLYCYQALRKKKAGIPENLVQQFRKDQTVVNILKGCMGNEKPVSSLANEDIFDPVKINIEKYKLW